MSIKKNPYWSFFWPLTLTGMAMLLARQFQNGVLARYPDAVREIAVFAIATSIFMLFNASLIFLPQMTTVFARSKRGINVCFRFTLISGTLFTLPLLLFGFSPIGPLVIGTVFGIDGDTLEAVLTYIRWLSPLILFNAFRQFYTGLLIQATRTGIITVLNVIYLLNIILILIIGFQKGFSATNVLISAQVASAVIQFLLLWIAKRRYYHLPKERAYQKLSYRESWSFFWPVALTSIMFALSRPIIYSFASRLPNPEPMVAALRVTFDFSVIFINPVNQFRHLFVTFGKNDPEGVRKFMIKVMFCVLALLALTAGTPIAHWLMHGLIGIEGEVLIMAKESLWFTLLIPVVMTLRNYFHGQAMVNRTTLRMGLGGVARVFGIYAGCSALLAAGWFNHMTGALMLAMGFATEAVVVYIITVLKRR